MEKFRSTVHGRVISDFDLNNRYRKCIFLHYEVVGDEILERTYCVNKDGFYEIQRRYSDGRVESRNIYSIPLQGLLIKLPGTEIRSYYYGREKIGFEEFYSHDFKYNILDNSYKYPRVFSKENIENVLNNSRYRYCQFLSQNEYKNLIIYLRKYKKNPHMEYMVKCGLEKHLRGAHLVKPAKRNMHEKFGMSKVEFDWFISSGYNLTEYQQIKGYAKQANFDDENLIKVLKAKGTKLLKKGLDLLKIYNKVTTDYSSYENYYEALVEMEIPLTEKNLYPRNFKEIHDKTYKELIEFRKDISKKQREEKELAFKNKVGKFKKYIFETDRYCVIYPHDIDALKNEGNILKHCVGTYDTKILSGECVVLFVREKDKSNEPLVTLELKSRKIVQARGYRNTQPEEPIMQFLNQFAEKKKLKLVI